MWIIRREKSKRVRCSGSKKPDKRRAAKSKASGRRAKHCKIRKKFSPRDWFFRPEKSDAIIFVKAALIVVALGRLFYQSWVAVVALSPIAALYVKKERARLEKDRIRKIGLQFKDAILSVAAGQRAGYSVENAFLEARQDMALLHGTGSEIFQELCAIAKGLANSLTLEEMLASFGERTGHPDIQEFAEIFQVAKRSGGNMTGVIADTAKIIADKLEVERQIGVLIAAKRMEAQMMEIVPLFIILYVGMTNPGFFDPLYHSVAGVVFMTIALMAYAGAYLLIEKIIDIEV